MQFTSQDLQLILWLIDRASISGAEANAVAELKTKFLSLVKPVAEPEPVTEVQETEQK